MKIRSILSMALMTLALGLTPGKSHSESNLYGIDINHDGKISMEEWQGNQRTFEERDLNHDKFLSGDELSPGMILTPSTAAGRTVDQTLIRKKSSTQTTEQKSY